MLLIRFTVSFRNLKKIWKKLRNGIERKICVFSPYFLIIISAARKS